MEVERFPQERGRAGPDGGKRILDCRTTLDAADAGTQWNLGGLHGRRLEDRDSVQGVREIFDAPGAESESEEDHAAARAAYSQPAAEDGEVQAGRAQPGQGVGRAVHASVLRGGAPRA